MIFQLSTKIKLFLRDIENFLDLMEIKPFLYFAVLFYYKNKYIVYSLTLIPEISFIQGISALA